eukprot:1150527-Pelagomonas_calceolata.AAC.1
MQGQILFPHRIVHSCASDFIVCMCNYNHNFKEDRLLHSQAGEHVRSDILILLLFYGPQNLDSDIRAGGVPVTTLEPSYREKKTV